MDDYEADLLREAGKAIARHPEARSQIVDLYRLVISEIKEGGSAFHEYELFMEGIGEIKNTGS
jgi:hypothetical protein